MPLPLDGAVEALMLQVDRDTVLRARAALLGEAQRLRRALWNSREGMHIGLCGDDPVSPQARDGFNRRISGLLEHCGQYTADLEEAGHRLGDIAAGYGYTEDEIAASFGGGR